MAAIIDTSRNGCALHGALATLEAIERVVPILHSTTGCGLQQYLGGNRVGGGAGSVSMGGVCRPSSNVIEKQIVFGGSSRLREQIKNTVRVISADLYVVLGGCATELVGDDILAMANEEKGEGYPVIYVPAPGFRGDVHLGYQQLVKGLIDQIPKIVSNSAEMVSGLVNIFGIIPVQDVFWGGNLAEIKRILEKLGLRVNTLFGFGQDVEAWQQIPNAVLNVVFSPWGLSIAEHLQEKYDIPFIQFFSLPVGDAATNEFLQKVAESLQIAADEIQKLQTSETRYLTYQLERLADTYFASDFQKEFAIVGETGLALGIYKFLVNTLGLIPKVVIFTDNPAVEYQGQLTEEVILASLGSKPQVLFTEDFGEISDAVKKRKIELILGSSLEQNIAAKLGVPHLNISFPIKGSVVLNKTYAGYAGAVSLLEDLGSAIAEADTKI